MHTLAKKKLKPTRIDLLPELFFLLDEGKPCNVGTGCLLISLKSRFWLLNNKVIKHDPGKHSLLSGRLLLSTQPVQHMFCPPGSFNKYLPVQPSEHELSSLIQHFFIRVHEIIEECCYLHIFTLAH